MMKDGCAPVIHSFIVDEWETTNPIDAYLHVRREAYGYDDRRDLRNTRSFRGVRRTIAPSNESKRGLFTCASEAGAKSSLAGALHMIPGLKGGVGGFVADAVGGNAFSGATDLIQSIATGHSGSGDDAHSVFYNMAQGVVAGPTQGFGSVFGKAIESTPWASGPMDAAMAVTFGEYASGVGELKLAYDAGSYSMGLFQCATGIIQ
jgi:hypothetical protein